MARPLPFRSQRTLEEEVKSMVPILAWLLGVPIGLIIVLLLLGVIHF
jgi:hypothetical protein